MEYVIEMTQPDAEPTRQCGKRQRQNESIIEPISQTEEQRGGKQQIRVPIVLQKVKARFYVRQFDANDEASEIQDIVQCQIRGMNLTRGIRAGAWQAGVKTDREESR